MHKNSCELDHEALVIAFFKDGDLVLKKATEYGAVEIWMNERARRACANSCADFLYGFLEVFFPHCYFFHISEMREWFPNNFK